VTIAGPCKARRVSRLRDDALKITYTFNLIPDVGGKMTRSATIQRKTNETDINLTLIVDGTGKYEVKTSVPFLDHMLSLMAKHGHFDLHVHAKGDIEIDYHHTVEDVGIVLGQAFKIFRHGGISGNQGADDDFAEAVHISGRSACLQREDAKGKVGDFDVELFMTLQGRKTTSLRRT
jgi:imidazoleglycerol-phosphate dehydratase